MAVLDAFDLLSWVIIKFIIINIYLQNSRTNNLLRVMFV